LIELVAPSSLYGDTRNPRETDPDRLELIRLSLQKFGFLLPLYATSERMLLSGHQRSTAADDLGWLVPVVIGQKNGCDTAGANLTFNRATNDFALTDIDHSRISAADLLKQLASLPDTENRYPCLITERRSVPELLALNFEKFERYAANAARQLASYGFQMPIIVSAEGEVINGIGRLQDASARQEAEIECVVLDSSIDPDLVAFALNRLSMDFQFSEPFRDILRSNAYRRSRQRRTSLGSGFLFALGAGRCKDFSPGREAARMRSLYGSRVLDFGAGHGDEAKILRKIGLKVTTFEPYKSNGQKPCVKAGRRTARRFLKTVAEGQTYSSIFLASVLNSVPFPGDRDHIVTICAALASPETVLYAAARSCKDPNWRECSVGIGLGTTAARSARFILKDEPGTAVSELNDAPKIQKFFQPSEFERLFKQRFGSVEIGVHINNVTAICSKPLQIDRKALVDALSFEFDLPYPGGRMGLVCEAIQAFEKRLEVQL